MAQSLSQAETQQAEEAEQDKEATPLPNLPAGGMLNPLVNLFNPQRHQHRWRRGRGGHGAGRGQHQGQEMETDSYEVRCHLLIGKNYIYTQQTTTGDFTCSGSEFKSSSGSIHMNSSDSVNKFDVSTCVYGEITGFSCDDTCQ